MTYLADRTNYVMHKIGKEWKEGEDVEHLVALSPLSNPKATYGDEEKKILKQFEEVGAIKIKDPNGRKTTGTILDIGFDPPRKIQADIMYLEVIGGMVEDTNHNKKPNIKSEKPEEVEIPDEVEQKQTPKTSWLRWIAVLPGALIAAFLVTFPLHWILYIAFAHNGTLLGFIELPAGANIPIERALYPFVIAITFILVGYKIAPLYKFNTSVALTVLYLISFASAIFLAPSQFSLEPRGILALIGSLLALYIAWRKARQEGKDSDIE